MEKEIKQHDMVQNTRTKDIGRVHTFDRTAKHSEYHTADVICSDTKMRRWKLHEITAYSEPKENGEMEYFTMTPTWAGLAPSLCAVLANISAPKSAHDDIREELRKVCGDETDFLVDILLDYGIAYDTRCAVEERILKECKRVDASNARLAALEE